MVAGDGEGATKGMGDGVGATTGEGTTTDGGASYAWFSIKCS
jgi:hypothetical protein